MSLGKTTVTSQDVEALHHKAVHTQHHGKHPLDGAGQIVSRTLKKTILVPTEETVKVPVVRKEVNRYVEKQTVKAQRLVPVEKFKEVQETTLETRDEMINGRWEKRSVPVTRTRRQPYTDFVEEEYDIVVDVPKEEVVTRTGYRMDKHVTSNLMEVEQDHHYELRAVLVKKSDIRHTELGEHHTFKKAHGTPVWDGDLQAGFTGKPPTPSYKPHLYPPGTSLSILSSAGRNATSRQGTAQPGTPSRVGLGTPRAGLSTPRADQRPSTGLSIYAQGESLL